MAAIQLLLMIGFLLLLFLLHAREAGGDVGVPAD